MKENGFVMDGGGSHLSIKLNLKDPQVQKACVGIEENCESARGDKTVLHVQEACKVFIEVGLGPRWMKAES